MLDLITTSIQADTDVSRGQKKKKKKNNHAQEVGPRRVPVFNAVIIFSSCIML